MKELGYVKKLAPRAAIDWTLLDQVIAENKSLYAGLKLKTVA
jgi:NitT/TauT family transport system substrate-binding protein